MNVKTYQQGGKISKFFKSYIQSPKYRERLVTQDYKNPESIIQQRLARLKDLRVVDATTELGSHYNSINHVIYSDPKSVKEEGFNAKDDEILAHEFSHGISANGPTPQMKDMLPGSTMYDLLNNQGSILNPNEARQLEGRNRLNVYNELGKKLIYTDPREELADQYHDRFGFESKADIDTLRYMMFRDKIYDTGTQDFNQEILNKIKEKYKDNSILKRMIKNFSDENLIYLMNNIAKTNNSENKMVAKRGGKFRGGGNIDPNGYLLSNMDNWQDQMIIPGGNITTEGMAFPIMANGVPLFPNTGEYQFDSPYVVEEPMYRGGGKYRKYQQGGQTPISEDYYTSSAQLAYYKQLLNDRLKAKNPQGFQDFFSNLSNLRRSNDTAGAESFIQSAQFNDYLSPDEVRSTLGDEYETYLNSLRNVNSMNVVQGRRPLYGEIEGEQDLSNLNYGRRFASLQLTPTYSNTVQNNPNRRYERQYQYNPTTREVDVKELGDVSLRPEGFRPAMGQPTTSRFKKGGKYRCGGRKK